MSFPEISWNYCDQMTSMILSKKKKKITSMKKTHEEVN